MLGFLWTLLNPLFFFSVTFLVFSHSVGQNVEDYGLFLGLGLLLWMFFSRTSALAAAIIERKRYSIRDSTVSPSTLMLASILSMIFGSLLESVFLLAMLFLWRGEALLFSFVSLPCAILVVSIFIAGISGVLAYLSTFARDVLHIWNLLLQIILFATPVFYPPDFLKGMAVFLVRFNPLTPVFSLSRARDFAALSEVFLANTLWWLIFVAFAGVGLLLCHISRVRIVEKL